MPRHAIAVAAIAVLLGGLAPAQAGIVVTVDKTAQRLSVEVDGAPRYQWPVSTARWGYRTPNGSYEISHLGRPASHGCIRLHPQNAAILFALVKDNMGDTQIVVTGDRPQPPARTRARGERKSVGGDTQRSRRSFEDIFDPARRRR